MFFFCMQASKIFPMNIHRLQRPISRSNQSKQIDSYKQVKENYDKSLKNKKLPKIIGCEVDEMIAKDASNNVRKAGLQNYIEIINCSFQEFQLPPGLGLLICNPPYGKRIGDENELPNLYKQ